ncbi:MAG: hypothetical protein ACRYFX_04520 [Janthinobacterium lividum]
MYDITKLLGFAGTNQKPLITRLVNGLQVVQDCTLRPNIKSKTNVTKLLVDGDVKPYDGVRDTIASVSYEPRTLEVFVGQYDVNIDTVKARETWMAEVMKPGVNPADIPFESQTWQAVMDDFASKINDNTVWNGRRDATKKTASALATGFGNIIKDEIQGLKLTPFVTGSMLTDTVAKIEGIYKSQPTKFRRLKQFAYCAYNVYDAYCEDYAAKFGTQPIYNQFQQLVIRHSEGNCILKPVTWMAGSERVIITPQSNMLVGSDLLSDGERILTNPKLYGLEAGILMPIGFQIEDLEKVAVNDHA